MTGGHSIPSCTKHDAQGICIEKSAGFDFTCTWPLNLEWHILIFSCILKPVHSFEYPPNDIRYFSINYSVSVIPYPGYIQFQTFYGQKSHALKHHIAAKTNDTYTTIRNDLCQNCFCFRMQIAVLRTIHFWRITDKSPESAAICCSHNGFTSFKYCSRILFKAYWAFLTPIELRIIM